jgi:hypothetical protein
MMTTPRAANLSRVPVGLLIGEFNRAMGALCRLYEIRL